MQNPPVPLPQPLPDGLIPFASEAVEAFYNKAIVHIEFSGPTYHIQCLYNNVSEWVFVQLNPDNIVEDLFCGCEECSKNGYCIHMAIAFIGIFNNASAHNLPLHLRFMRSPMYVLGQEYYANNSIQKNGSKLIIGPIECTGAIDQIEKIAIKNEEQTEENSIKFSNCSDEELCLWQEGNICERLAFELSPLTDLLKYIFILSEQQNCFFEFESASTFPTAVTIHMQQISCSFPLPPDIQDLLNSLVFYQTNLKIEPFGGKEIQKIEYEAPSHLFSIILTGNEVDLSHATPIRNSSWFYLKERGFIRKLDEKFYTHLSLNELPFFFDKGKEPYSLHTQELQRIRYTLAFDSELNLTIAPYIQKPHDILNATAFGLWIWQESSGFIHVEPSQVPLQGLYIPIEKISKFIETHSNFLSSQKGFAVHQNSLNKLLSYKVDHCGALTFTQQSFQGFPTTSFDMYDWVYVPNEGFYPKQNASALPIDIPIPPHKIASCITHNRSLLEQIPHFFAIHNPIKETALSITFRKNHITGQPTYVWKNPEYEKRTFLYSTFGYIEGIGFFSLPSTEQDQTLEFSIPTQDKDAWVNFFLEKLPLLHKSYTCILDPCLVAPKQLTLICQNAKTHTPTDSDCPDLFEASFYYQSEIGEVTAHELTLLSLKVQRFAPTKAGLIDLSDPRFTWLSALKTHPHSQPYQLKHYDFLKIEAFDHIHFDESTETSAQEILRQLINGHPVIEADFSDLRSSLRPYQYDGVRWLWNLYLRGLSGLLCDDMGVGKTHQALGLIAATGKFRLKNHKKPLFLVVCPTSLIWHWKDKVELLLPQLQVCMYVGTGRSELHLNHDYDILITTYGTWRNDVAYLGKIHFEIAIFDELQIAKNHISQIWSALTKVSSHIRIGLTGTPIENRLRELKALFDIIIPGYFPKENSFKNRPSLGKGRDFKSVIAAYAKPFVLRRRKQDVLQELPMKTENMLSVELLPEQKELYRKVAARETATILTMLENQPGLVPYMHIFALLSALKQICNHPATHAKDIENYEAYSSGKWEAFQELLEEAFNSGQKVVVFSHSLPMLDIMERFLIKKGIHFAQIRGSTKDRKSQLDLFQKDPKCKIFLASLMAAGLGIDLTAGSVVIHYDRWWNAARENQATDRVHRLGQSRGVMVYKLMSTKTIEERIDRIISGKASLLENVISYDDHRIIKQLSRQELIELLKGIEDV